MKRERKRIAENSFSGHACYDRKGLGACYRALRVRPQISRLAAASTIPVTNAAKQENSRSSLRILVIADPLRTRHIAIS